MDRRQFIKVTAATSASATLASCGNPELHLARFIPEEEIIPGIVIWRPSVCPLCSAGCGIQVKVMQGEAEVIRNGQLGLIKMGLAKKLEGNAAHPISQGKLCARGQAAIQLTYHPDRIAHPLKRTGDRGSGQFQEITWDAAMDDLKSHLNALESSGEQKLLSFLTRPLRGQRRTLISEFLTRFGAPPAVEFEVFGEQVLREANARCFGHEQLPTADFANSRYVMSFGADFLGTWNSPTAQNIGYGEMRQGRPGIRAKLVQVEPRMSQTGANADEWVPVKPGTEGVLALGIAHVLMKNGLHPAPAAARALAQIDGSAQGFAAYSPDEVEKITGVKADRVERLAREFASNGPAVALIGGAPLAQSNGMFHALAVNALNALVGSIGVPGGIVFTPQIRPAPPKGSTLQSLFASPSPKLLLLYNANPVFGSPVAWRVKEGLMSIPYIVSFGQFIDETSVLSDLILPDHSFLESWVDDIPESGSTMAVISVARPVMKPLHQTRPMADVLLELGRDLPWKTYDEVLKAAFASIPAPKAANPDEQVDVFVKAQQDGGWWGELPQRTNTVSAAASGGRPVSFTEPQFDGDAAQYPFHFMPYASQALLDGSLAHLPWLQEMPDVLTTGMWTSWIEINPQTASRLAIALGDLVEVTSSQGSLRSPAVISPGIAPDVIGMPVGQGHENFTRYASGLGANPLGILAPVTEQETGSLAWAATRVRVAKVEGKGGLILFAGGMRENETEHR
jgi:anaerobic selenocysteine-containing dehydrogenase